MSSATNRSPLATLIARLQRGIQQFDGNLAQAKAEKNPRAERHAVSYREGLRSALRMAIELDARRGAVCDTCGGIGCGDCTGRVNEPAPTCQHGCLACAHERRESRVIPTTGARV